MSCYKPMHMAVLKFVDSNEAWHFKAMHKDKDAWKVNVDTCRAYRLLSTNSRNIDVEAAFKNHSYDIIEVPCGNCIGCRLDYSKDWANRATFEADQYEYNWFVTLTYDDDNLVKGQLDNATLVKEHFTKFIKDLRHKFDYKGHTGVKFLGCGEYGDLSARPHYHIILFNCPLPDLTLNFPDGEGHITHHFDSRGVPYMFSQFIKDCWPYGNILIADCNWNTSAYVSQYVMKKQKGKDAKLYQRLDILPPFLRMSNGIGKAHFENNKNRYVDMPRLYVGRPNKKPLECGLPRYYKKMLKNDGLIDYEDMILRAIENSEKSRSLLEGKQKINDNRAIKEAKQISFQTIKERIAN